MVGIPKGWEIEAEPGPSPFDLNAAADFGSQWGRVTSTARTPEHNREVGGVPNSYHLTTRGARAIDIARGPGVRHADIEAAYRGAGYDLIESLDEGDHSHFAFRSGPAAPQPEQQAAGIPDGWEIEAPEAAPARPQAPPMAASFAPVPAQAPLLSSAPQLTQDDRTRGLAVDPAEPAQAQSPWSQGYKSTVDPEKVKQLQAALNGGASVEDLVTLSGQLGVQLDGGVDAVRAAVKYRDSGRKGAGFYAEQVGVPKKEEPIITSRDWEDLSIPQKAGDIMGNFARALGHPYANRIESETAMAADWIPFIGGAASIERGGEEFKRGEYGAAALNAALGSLDFIPAIGMGGKFVAKNADEAITNISRMIGRDLTPSERAVVASAASGPARASEGVDIGATLGNLEGQEFSALKEKLERRSVELPPENTRGRGTYYHGARGEVPELNEGYYNPSNIYGGMDTFYTSDAADAALGYGRKRDAARLYEVGERQPVNFFDMEEPQSVEFLNEVFGVRPDDIGLTPAAIEEAVSNAGGKANLRQVMDEIRDASAGEGVSRDEVQEIFGSAIDNLRQRGFGGMTHRGGLKTGKPEHNVRIYFDAPNQIDLRDVSPIGYTPVFTGQAAAAGDNVVDMAQRRLAQVAETDARQMDESYWMARTILDAAREGKAGNVNRDTLRATMLRLSTMTGHPTLGTRAKETLDVLREAEGVLTGPRVIDRIDVNIPKGWEVEPPLGRTRPMDTLATPEEMAEAARAIKPQDIRPIPANQLEGLDEFERIGNPRPLLTPPNPADELAMRNLGGRNRRGPPDLVTWIRSQPWGLKDEGGELAHYGITNAPRRGVDFAGGEGFIGRLVDNANGRSLDDAAQAAWEAGYFPNHAARPSVSEFLETLSDTHRGNNRAFRADDLEEVERYGAAAADRDMIQSAAQEGKPLADDVGQPIGLDDLSANEPPAYAYEDLPKLGERVGNIDTSKLDTPQAIARAMKNIEARLGGFDAARGGQVSHAETKALAAELGMTVDELLKVRRGRAFNHSEATAARTILAKSYDELVSMSKRIADEGASDEELEAFAKAVLRTGAIHEKVTGAIAEAGRALQSMRIPVSSKAISGRIHEAVIAGVGGRDRLQDVAKEIIELQRIGNTPGDIAKFAKGALKPRWSDYAVEYYYNALLSGPSTHIVNTVSNLATQLTQIPEHLIAAGIGNARAVAVRLAKGQKVADNILLSEVGARALGMMEGAKEGLRAFGKVMKTGDPTDPLTKVEARRHKAIPGVAGSVIRTPTRLLMAEDEFFKATARRSSLAGLAVRKARNEGVRGAAAKARIAELAANPTDDMLQQSFDYARYLTFQSPLGSFGQKLSGATEAVPALKLVIPFIRTPINLFKYSLERTPVAQLALKRVRDDYRAGGERRDLAIAKAWFGTGIGALAVTYAAQGMITGRGPTDPSRRRMMMADGWQPYSIKIGDTYYSYSRLDPFATMLGMAADLAASSDQMTPKERENAYTVLTGNIMGQIESKTWLSGLTDLVQALDDPGRFGESYVSRLAGSLVPTISAHATRVTDPIARETVVNDDIAASTVNRIKSRIPGLSDELPARLDAWGQPITSDEPPIVDMLSPFYMQKAKDDPITAEMLQVGVGMGKPRRVITDDGEEITLNDKQFAEYQRLSGLYIRDDIANAMADPEWSALPPEMRKREIKKMMAGARKDARADILGGMDEGSAPEVGAAVPKGWEVVR